MDIYEERLQYCEDGLEEYRRMISEVEFDVKNHLLIVIEDDSGNIVEFVGAAMNDKSAKRVLRIAYKRAKKYNFKVSPSLMKNGMARSFVC